MWTLKLFLFSMAFVLASSEFQMPNLDAMGNILQTLKDNGMMDQFQEKFSQMFVKEKMESRAKEDINENSSNDPTFDVFDFTRSYNAEKKLNLDKKVLFYLSELPIVDNYHTHMVKLTGVLDQIGSITSLKNQNIDLKIIDLVKRTKSLSVVKTSLDKLHQEAIRSQNPDMKTSEETKNAKNTGNDDNTIEQETKVKTSEDLPEMVRTYLESVKDDPDQLIDLITTTLSDYEFLSEETTATVGMYAKMLANLPYFNLIIDMAGNWLEEVARHPIGGKVITMVPGLLQAEDIEEVFDIIHREVDLSMNRVVVLIKDFEMQDQVAEFLSAFMAAGIKGFHEVVYDNTKMSLANTFLVSQGFPAINVKQLPSSLSNLASKVFDIFSWNVNVKKFEKLTVELIKAFDKDFMKWSDFNPLSEDQQIPHLKRFLHENVADSFNHLWQAQQLVSRHADGPRCLQNMLCHINSHMRTKRNNRLKILVNKIMSLVASWAWSFEGSFENRDLNEAIIRGGKKEDCDVIYGQPDVKSCHIFPWQIKAKRHEEL